MKTIPKFSLLASLAVVATGMFPQGAKAAEKLATEKATQEIAPLVVKGANPLTRDMFVFKQGAETLEPKSSTLFPQPDLLAQLYPVEVYKCTAKRKLTYLDGRLSRWVNRTVGSGNSFPNAQYTAEQKAGLRLQCIALSGKASFNKDWANPKGAIN